MGNFVSNQRRNLMGLKTGHTEDGMIFEATFSKYSDGSVVFDKIKVIPTWVNLHTENGRSVYSVLPLTKEPNASALGLGPNGLESAKASYARTSALVSAGVKKCNDYLSSVRTPDEEYNANNQPAAA